MPEWNEKPLKVSKKEADSIHNYKKEVKVRKNYRCINCDSLILKGSIALVHSMQVNSARYAREYYCKNCYIMEEVR
jgi:predicted SprT family Zn-dependent metalloprotease